MIAGKSTFTWLICSGILVCLAFGYIYIIKRYEPADHKTPEQHNVNYESVLWRSTECIEQWVMRDCISYTFEGIGTSESTRCHKNNYGGYDCW